MNRRLFIILVVAGASFLRLSSAMFSQQGTPPAGAATISGRVSIGKDPAVGVLVAAQRELTGESIVLEPASMQAFTDSEGSYILSGLKAGSYTVQPFAAGFVNADDVPVYTMEKTRPEKTVHLAEGDRATGVDFSLSAGGVICGRIVDTDGWPVAAKRVHLTPGKEKRQVFLQYSSGMLTDDRGMYRLFGVPPGRYWVSVGEVSSDGRRGRSNPMDPQMPVTYYPGVADLAQATAVEVAEGRETTGIDFKTPRFLRGYRVSGFMREAESGRPVPSLRFMIYQVDAKGRSRGFSAIGMGGGNGEFEQGDLSSGKYMLSLGPSQDASYSADPVPFEVVDQDLKDLILRLRRGNGEINGQVILEGLDPAEAAAKLRTVELRAVVIQHRVGMDRRSPLALDGSFSLQDLPPGEVMFNLSSNDFSLVRYDFNGPPGNYLLEGIPLESGQQIIGLKLYFVEGKGTLVGTVRTETGPLPTGVKCYIIPTMENNPDNFFGTETDDRGMFRLEGLPPGEVVLHINPAPVHASTVPSKLPDFQETLHRVTILPRQETRVEVVVNLEPEKGGDSSSADNP